MTQSWEAFLASHEYTLDEFNALDERIRKIMTGLYEYEADAHSKSLDMLRDSWTELINRTDSEYHEPSEKMYKPITPVRQGDGYQEIQLPQKFFETGLYARKNEHHDHSCDSEEDVVFRLKILLNAVIRGLGLENFCEVVLHRHIAGTKIDIGLLYKPNRMPIGGMEVKKPLRAIDDANEIFGADSIVAGQNLKQLQGIYISGIDKVFGMISTYNSIMLTSLHPFDVFEDPGLDPRAGTRVGESDGSSYKSPIKQQVSGRPDDQTLDEEADREIFSNNDEEQEQNKKPYFETLYATAPISTRTTGNGIHGLQMMVAWIWSSLHEVRKMQDRPRVLRGKLPSRRIVHGIDTEKFAFEQITVDKGVDLTEYTAPAVGKDLYLVHYIGGGDFGDCCIATEASGNSCCVVKFFQRQGANEDDTAIAERCNREVENWRLIYHRSFESQYGRIKGGPHYIVMPYLRPLTEEDRDGLLEDPSALKEALRDFAMPNGEDGDCFVHKDLKVCHLGYYKNKIYLLDLATVEKMEDDVDVEAWLEESTKTLLQRMRTSEGESFRRVVGADEAETVSVSGEEQATVGQGTDVAVAIAAGRKRKANTKEAAVPSMKKPRAQKGAASLEPDQDTTDAAGASSPQVEKTKGTTGRRRSLRNIK